MNNRVASLPRRMWSAFQVLGLFTMIVTPLWMHHDIDVVASGSGSSKIFDSDRLDSSSISSRVLFLPEPALLLSSSASQLEFSVETKQLRFQKVALPASNPLAGSKRDIASVTKNSAKWNLVQIERHTEDNAWERVELVASENEQNLGSVFVELNEGSNEFRVTFEGMHGRRSTYPVRVNFVRTNI